MNIKVRTNISSEFQDIEICINAPERNEIVQTLENELLSKSLKSIQQIVAMQDNDIFIINVSDIILFFGEEKNNFCKTKDGIYKIKERLYYLEEVLPTKEFVRISNSAIININHVKCFNTSIVGKIKVKFKDGTEEDVSKRRTTEIMRFLKERRCRMEKQERKISLKKLLLTILCTTIVSIFVGNTVLLVDTVPQWLETEKILSINRNSKYLIEIGENNQDNVKQLEEKYKEERALFGEKYPAEMMHLMQIANYFTNRIIKVYTLSILIGVSTGAIIYIISIQRAKGKQLIIELIISLLIVFGLVLFTNLGYEAYINNHVQIFNMTKIRTSAYIYELEIKDILISYVIVAIVIYIGNIIRQKILTHKLNKEIENKN